MRRTLRVVLVCTALASTLAPAAAGAKTIVTHSPDSLAPAGAPAHWLPPEAWVYNHWVPYDEGRLYALLHIDRAQLWQQLRDDHRTLAQLAARHGWTSPARLAAALVAPRAHAVGAARLAQLRARALRTITQGHLAQHLFFHSLHQFAIPSAAPDIFGVTDARFRELRRAELSPLAIGRLHDRSPGEVQAGAVAVLRERIAAGVGGGAMTARQARLLLRRQLSQLPRWLDQERYNGPPLTHRGALVQLPQDYASNPAISADGRFVAYEAYRQKLKLAVRLGEIAILRADLSSGTSDLISGVLPPGPTGAQPSSDYNPSISAGGGRVTYESSAGNQNFAKRYGRIGVLLCDLGGAAPHTSEIQGSPAGPALADSKSAYNPVVSADGASVAYEAVRDGRTVVRVAGPGGVRTAIAGHVAGSSPYADPYEPGLSADGARVVVTMTRGRLSDPGSGTSAVEVRDLARGRTLLASRADGATGAPAGGFSADGAISPDGRWVAFTSNARNLGAGPGLGLFLRDLDGGRTVHIPAPDGTPLDPVVSEGGVVVAFTVARGRGARVYAWHAADGRIELVSRAGPEGAAGNGSSEDPSISADGTRVAFASTATNLVPGATSGVRGIFVRDRAARTTRLVSDPARAYVVTP